MLCISAMTMAQNTITGKVVNNDNEPLAFVNVLIKGTNIGAITNEEGNYTISLNENAESLVFSYLGFKSQNIRITKSNTVNVLLLEDSEELMKGCAYRFRCKTFNSSSSLASERSPVLITWRRDRRQGHGRRCAGGARQSTNFAQL